MVRVVLGRLILKRTMYARHAVSAVADHAHRGRPVFYTNKKIGVLIAKSGLYFAIRWNKKKFLIAPEFLWTIVAGDVVML